RYAGNYTNRLEAITYAQGHLSENGALDLLTQALNDPYFQLRSKAITALGDTTLNAATEDKILQIAKTDPKRTVRADAIDLLASKREVKYKDFFLANVRDSSYSVAGSALQALQMIDPQLAGQQARLLSKEPAKGKLATTINAILILSGDESSGEKVLDEFEILPF